MGANSSVAAAGPHSLDADVILKLHEAPLFSVEGYAFSAGAVIITGTALPMSGGSDAVRLVSEPGVKATFEAGLPSPNAAATYWYLADAARSAFRITVDLAGTWHGGDYYRFGLRFAGSAEDAAEVIRTGFLVPKSLSLLENYPSQDALQRVMRFETIGGVAINGASDADRILRLAEMHGFDRRTGTVLDWGVRHGRVLRFFRPLGAGRALHGIDNDPANTTWASEHLPDLKITLGPPMPPMPYADASFDLLYGISVMTHLSEEVQRAWLAEIDRVLRPGGLALLTFAGDTTVAFGSRYLDRAWLDKYLSTGRGPDLPDKSLVGIIADPSYYKNVNVTLPKVVELCSGYLEVAAAYPCMFGYQDLVVLRSLAAPPRAAGDEARNPASLTARPMRIAAHLGVMNEVRLIGPCVEHLRRIGVDEFIVCDMGSTDGTREWLRGQEGPMFRIVDSTNQEPAGEWMRRNLDAVMASTADWVIMLDADEFPLPAEGDLRRVVASAEADAMWLMRYNVVLGPGGPRMPFPQSPETYSEVDLYVAADPALRERLEADAASQADDGAYWLRFVPLPKMIARRDVVAGFADGMHDIVPPAGRGVRRMTTPLAVIAHVALSDYARFALKVDNAREMFRFHDAQLSPGFGWHWKRWIRLADSGALQAEYERSILGDAELAKLRAEGVVCTAAEMLAAARSCRALLQTCAAVRSG